MTTVQTISGDARITGALRLGGSIQPERPRTEQAQETLVAYPIPWTAWRVFDALQTNLPGTAATDDLALIGGTHGTGTPSLQTEDLKTAGATDKKARCQITLPDSYDAGQSVSLRFHAGMLTTVADTTATIDALLYKSDEEAGAGADLVSTAAQSINSLTLADFDFVVTPSGLTRGDILDLLVTLAINDGAGGTAVKGIIGAAYLLCDIRG